MKIPEHERAVIPPEKVQAYLLSSAHIVGRHKAAFFSRLGYTQTGWRTLERDLRRTLTLDTARVTASRYGTKYEIRSRITGPNSQTADIVTIWIVRKGEDFPRFVTAYPQD